MLSVSSRIWTRVTVSISYNDTHYTTILSRREFWVSPSPGRILGHAYAIFTYGQISCAIPSKAPCPLSQFYSYTHFVKAVFIHLFDKRFRFSHLINPPLTILLRLIDFRFNIVVFITSFVFLFEENQFLTKCFHSVAIYSCVRFCHSITW